MTEKFEQRKIQYEKAQIDLSPLAEELLEIILPRLEGLKKVQTQALFNVLQTKGNAYIDQRIRLEMEIPSMRDSICSKEKELVELLENKFGLKCENNKIE